MVVQVVDLFTQVGVLCLQVVDLLTQLLVLCPRVETYNSHDEILLKNAMDLLKQAGDYCPYGRTLKRQ